MWRQQGLTRGGRWLQVRLAKEAQEAARVAITVDPQSDIAHHLMGRCGAPAGRRLSVASCGPGRLPGPSRQACEEKDRPRLLCEAPSAGAHPCCCYQCCRRWHYEMAQINPLLRTLVRLMYGTTLSPGTHADALASYVRAVELAPQRLIHRVEQGKVLMALGRREAAAVAFKVRGGCAYWPCHPARGCGGVGVVGCAAAEG